MGYAEVNNTIHPPTHADVFLCRYTRKDKLGIALIERLRRSNKKINNISNQALHTAFNPDKNPGLMGNIMQTQGTPLPQGSVPSAPSPISEVNNPVTHWNFPVTDPPPSDWDIVNFTPRDLYSKGNNMVVMNKKTLRLLDQAASRASQYGHPPIKLTNQVDPGRNGGYRDPVFNKKQRGATSSRHQYGDGFDIWTQKWSKAERLGLLKNLYSLGFRGFGHGPNNIHADTARKRQWNYQKYSIPEFREFDGSQS